MTTNENKKKKSSVTRKVVPAAGMLAISAAMLASSTYAWFTMSREVEVTGIKMTASVPEDLQISLGKLAVTGTPAEAVVENNSTTYSLATSTGVLFAAANSVAGDGNATTPTTNAWDWSNSADISAYYDIGRLIPASSNSGHDIFFTPDASGVGKTVKENANYYRATTEADNLAAVADSNPTSTAANANFRATLHALTNTRDAATGADDWATGGNGKYTQAAKYNLTYDDGYYVDIPIWIRSSSNEAVNLSVDGYVIPGTTSFADDNAKKKQTELELYRAVRVALLDGEKVTASATTGAVACDAGDTAVTVASGNERNIIPLKDAWVKEAGTTLVNQNNAATDTTEYTKANILASYTPFAVGNPSIVDTANIARTGLTMTTTGYQKTDGKLYGVSALTTGTLTGSPNFAMATYSAFDTLVPTSGKDETTARTPDTVATVEGSGTGGQYGTAKKLIIRVWLDGEDGECWNDNAGQDWAISLRFSKIETVASTPSTPTQP